MTPETRAEPDAPLHRANAAAHNAARAALEWRDARDAFRAVDESPKETEREWRAAIDAEQDAEEALVVAADAYEDFMRGVVSDATGGEK